MTSARIFLALGGVAAIAACVPKAEQPPAPPQPRPVQPRPAPPPPPPAPVDWSLIPLTPGGWIYRSEGNGSQALFGPTGGEAAFIVACDRAARQITLIRTGAAAGTAMAIRTSYGARNFPVTRRTAPPAGVSAPVAASDRFLDDMAFSRGRFTVDVAGAPILIIPPWPEPARAIEDCRG